MPRVLGAVRAAATINVATCSAADFSSSIEVFIAIKKIRPPLSGTNQKRGDGMRTRTKLRSSDREQPTATPWRQDSTLHLCPHQTEDPVALRWKCIALAHWSECLFYQRWCRDEFRGTLSVIPK
jgi:hypothetical protein